MTRVDTTPQVFSEAEAAATSAVPPDAAALNQRFAEFSTTPLGQAFVGSVQSSGLSLSALPIEVRLAVMNAQHEAITEFLNTWSESIRENAARDKQAAKKRGEQQHQVNQHAQQQAALAAFLKTAENRGWVSPADAASVRATAGIADPESTESQPTRTEPPPGHDPTSGLPRSDAVGVRLRSRPNS